VKTRLTAKAIERIDGAAGKRREIPDGLIAGLYFVVQPSGAKSWAVRYRHNRRPRKHTIGTFPALGLAEARDAATRLLTEVAKGSDPAGEKQERRATARRDVHGQVIDERLWENVIADFIELYANPRLRSASVVKRCLERETLPRWRGRHIQDITKRDIVNLVDSIAARGYPISARRTYALVRKVFNWSVGRALIETHPCHKLELPGVETKRDRVLSDAELDCLWHAAERLGWPFGPLVQLLVLTGQRLREVGGMKWSEIDTAAAVWTIPRERAKNGQAHIVPLSETALRVLAHLPRVGTRPGFVFTTNGRSPVSGFSKAKRALDRFIVEENARTMADPTDHEIDSWVFHDIRRTVASGLRRLGQPIDVTEKILNHVGTSFSGVRGVYQRYDYGSEKAKALEAWGQHIDLLAGYSPPRNVVALRV
jgi:integrase